MPFQHRRVLYVVNHWKNLLEIIWTNWPRLIPHPTQTPKIDPKMVKTQCMKKKSRAEWKLTKKAQKYSKSCNGPIYKFKGEMHSSIPSTFFLSHYWRFFWHDNCFSSHQYICKISNSFFLSLLPNHLSTSKKRTCTYCTPWPILTDLIQSHSVVSRNIDDTLMYNWMVWYFSPISDNMV